MCALTTDGNTPIPNTARRIAKMQAHMADYIAANGDRGDGKAMADPCATPLLALANSLPADAPLTKRTHDVGFRLEEIAFLIRRTSHEAWSAITQIELMFSDIRRLAPRFAFSQLRGQARIATGNEYRLAIADLGYLSRLNAAATEFTTHYVGPSGAGVEDRITVRRMDLRIVHAGPFGGETATMTCATLRNHRLAGSSSFWAVIHGDDDGLLRVSMEAAELFRWSWAPERLADLHHGAAPGEDARILDWPWYFERVAAALDGEPVTEPSRVMALAGPWSDIGCNSELRAALSAHPSLSGIAAQFDAGE